MRIIRGNGEKNEGELVEGTLWWLHGPEFW